MIRSLSHLKKLRPSLAVAEDMETALVGIWAKMFFKVPFVFDFIDDYSRIVQCENQPLRRVAFVLMEKMVPKLADLVIVVDPVKREFCRKLGVQEEKIILIPNGFDRAAFRPQNSNPGLMRELAVDPKSRLLVFVGKLNPYYKLEVLIASLSILRDKVPDVKLVMVGEGKDRKNLERFCDKLGVASHVRFTGSRHYSKIPEFINLAEVCLFPIPVGSALVLYEYMACGKPVVAPLGGTEKMGIPVEMFPEDCILRVEDSPRGFAQGVLKLLEDKRLCNHIGANALRYVSVSHSWDKLSSLYLQALQKCCSE